MTASTRRTVTVVVAALGVALLLVWAASVGPHRVVVPQPSPSTTEQTTNADVAHAEQEQREASNASRGLATPGPSSWVRDVGTFLLLLAGLVLIGVLLRALLIRIQRSLGEERLVVPMTPLPDLHRAKEAVEEGHERQQEALAGTDVRNAIVACWLVFEDAAAEADVTKGPAETASAFVVRFLHLLDVDPRPVGELSHLFLEARFSTHPMPPDARSRAQAALDAIHRDLAHSGVAS